MPLYTYACDNCELVEDDILLTLAEHEEGYECTTCMQPMHTVPFPTATIGPMPSKPMRLGGAGVDVHSVEELRQYKADNPNDRLLSRNDSGLKQHKWEARQKAEVQSQRMGFRDWDHRQASYQKDRKKQQSG